MEDIKYKNETPDKPAPPLDDQKSKASTGKEQKKRKAVNKPSEKMNSTKKKKISDEKGKGSELGSSQRINGKKDSPKKDVSAGMKNLMAQFVKRTPPKSSKDKQNHPPRPNK